MEAVMMDPILRPSLSAKKPMKSWPAMIPDTCAMQCGEGRVGLGVREARQAPAGQQQLTERGRRARSLLQPQEQPSPQAAAAAEPLLTWV